jgi:hypothetical protein
MQVLFTGQQGDFYLMLDPSSGPAAAPPLLDKSRAFSPAPGSAGILACLRNTLFIHFAGLNHICAQARERALDPRH